MREKFIHPTHPKMWAVLLQETQCIARNLSLQLIKAAFGLTRGLISFFFFLNIIPTKNECVVLAHECVKILIPFIDVCVGRVVSFHTMFWGRVQSNTSK